MNTSTVSALDAANAKVLEARTLLDQANVGLTAAELEAKEALDGAQRRRLAELEGLLTLDAQLATLETERKEAGKLALKLAELDAKITAKLGKLNALANEAARLTEELRRPMNNAPRALLRGQAIGPIRRAALETVRLAGHGQFNPTDLIGK